MTVMLTGSDLTADEVCRVARDGERVELAPDAVSHMSESRAVVEAALQRGAPVYGLTTGVGVRERVMLNPDEIGSYNRSLVLNHRVGFGPPATASTGPSHTPTPRQRLRPRNGGSPARAGAVHSRVAKRKPPTDDAVVRLGRPGRCRANGRYRFRRNEPFRPRRQRGAGTTQQQRIFNRLCGDRRRRDTPSGQYPRARRVP